MTANQENLEEMVQEAEGAQFVYRPISPNEAYGRTAFLNAQDQLNDLERYREALDKDPHDVKAREEICKTAFGRKEGHLDYSPEQMRIIAKETYKSGAEGMGRYVQNNEDKFFDMLDGKALQNLVMTLPMYKNGKKEHDDLVELINDVNSMGKILHESEVEKMRRGVEKLTKSKNVPDWAKKLIKYFSGDQRFVQEVYVKSYFSKKAVLGNALTKDREPDRDKLKGLIKDSLKVAYDKGADEKDEGKRNDIWEDCIRPYYLEMAKYAFGFEKKAFEDDNEELRERNEREEKRSGLGMAA